MTKDNKELLEELRKLLAEERTTPCTDCGHCPTCGRRNAPTMVWHYQVQHYYGQTYTLPYYWSSTAGSVVATPTTTANYVATT